MVYQKCLQNHVSFGLLSRLFHIAIFDTGEPEFEAHSKTLSFREFFEELVILSCHSCDHKGKFKDIRLPFVES